MTRQKPVPVPAPSPLVFENGIAHPDLWLWDSWTAELNGTLHLYCLALSRTDAAGRLIQPSSRNDFAFHIRHFTSADGGWTWQDEGAFLTPQDTPDGAFSRNVWSGCMLASTEGDWICGFTGLRDGGQDHPFLQTICIGRSRTGFHLENLPEAALSCPVRDYDAIRTAGYYLPGKDLLGYKGGEEGGPILAWRDPFIVEGSAGLEVFWSAKVSPVRGAVAHATVKQNGTGFHIETLHPPILLPDAHSFTQAEVPKLHYDKNSDIWYLMVSACDRINEEQSAEDVTKVLRLYESRSLRGPWVSAFEGRETEVPNTEHLFGASFLQKDLGTGQLYIIAPYTEYAGEQKQLTFAPTVVIDTSRAITNSHLRTHQDSH